jgi:regulator of protease activity HflC (stomatin/prohibitin superfamily)
MVFIKFIPTSFTGVRQTFGKFTKLCTPGINFYIPIIQKISLVSNRLKQDSVTFDVKTKDNVFCRIGLAVQHRIKPEDSATAYFSLTDPEPQIESYIENVVRAYAPRLILDELFESQDDICHRVSESLYEKMIQHGYTIENTLVTGIEPDEQVKQSMNQINASARLKEAAKNDADAEYIKSVRQAEADRDRKRLQGEGISLQRLAILKGYEQGLSRMTSQLHLNAKDVIAFVTKVQELDTMENIGKSDNTKVLFFSSDKNDALRNTIVQSQECNNVSNK